MAGSGNANLTQIEERGKEGWVGVPQSALQSPEVRPDGQEALE